MNMESTLRDTSNNIVYLDCNSPSEAECSAT